MIDTSKQYTYNGKPVRIYADGSDTDNSEIHCAIQDITNGKWFISIDSIFESDLVEVWEPKQAELVWAWDYHSRLPRLINYECDYYSDHYAPFKGELPEAFKGLQ